MKERPNIFVLDAPPENLKTVEKILSKENAVTVLNEKITRARLESINGKDSESFLQNFEGQPEAKQNAQRLFNREQNLTSRHELSADETVVAGQFWSKSPANANLAEVSVERGIAETLRIQLGDKLVFNIQGVPVKVKVTSLRVVRWMNFRPNFLFILHPSVLMDAPYSALVAAHIQDPKGKSQALSKLFQELPGLTTIDASEFSAAANRLIQGAIDIVRTLGWILFAGALINVCLTAWTSYTLRAQHFSLYRCLGANNTVVMSACVAEFLILCVVGIGLGLAASGVLSALVAAFILNADDQLNNSFLPSVSVAATLLCIGTAAGVLTATLILKQPPLKILRQPS
jgi:putative ABC transport system permease protein